MASSLTVNNIDGGYGSVRVLHDLSITVDFGETVVLLGSNGNGKSTLLKCITGLIKPDRGEIILNVDGEKTDLVGKTPEEVVTAGISNGARGPSVISRFDRRGKSLSWRIPEICTEKDKAKTLILFMRYFRVLRNAAINWLAA